MQEQQPVRRIPLAVVGAVSAALLAAGGGAWWVWNSAQAPTTPPPTTSQVSPSPRPVQSSAQNAVQVYWLNASGNKLELVPSPVNLPDVERSPSADLEDAFKRLLAGPSEQKFSSTIPEGTKLRGVEVRDDGVHVDLSQEFTTGGGSASMMGRVGQVIYTASSLNPDAQVWIDVEGKPLEVLGGEGLLIDQPMTRKGFQENFEL